MRILFLTAYFLCFMILPVLAQTNTDVTISVISYDVPQQDTITDDAFFDWWRLSAGEGDVIVVTMDAADGLVPLIGFMDNGGNLLSRSDTEGVAPMNGRAMLEYRVETAGEYTIIATRDGNQNGISTGSYTLEVRRANAVVGPRENPYQEVEFRCAGILVTTVATIEFLEEPNPNLAEGTLEHYRLTVYGLDGFEPMIRAEASVNTDPLDCTDDAQATIGNTFTLTDGTDGTITTEDLGEVAQLRLRNNNSETLDLFGRVTFTIASKNGASGRYIAVLEGLSINTPTDADSLQVRLGPKARDTQLNVYMVGLSGNRLDPFIWLEDELNISLDSCDDAAMRGCEGTPPILGTEIFSAVDNLTITADRFDAGLSLKPGTPDKNYLRLISRDNNTEGGYAVIFIGELP